MKNLFPILIFILLAITTQAQVGGPAIQFDYNASGFRVKRFYNPTAVYKPGKSNGQQADTLIGYYKDKSDHSGVISHEFIKAYPNPVSDKLYVENLNWKEGHSAEIKLMDISGKQILSVQTSNAKDEISFNSVVPGSYQVRYYIDGQYTISWKIIKL